MKKVIEFPNNKLGECNSVNQEIIEREAVEWLIKLDGDIPPTQQELRELKEWMALSPEYTAEIENLGIFWSNLELTELNIPLIKPTVMGSLIGWIAEKCRFTEFRFSFSVSALAVLGIAFALQQTWLSGWYSVDRIASSNGFYATAIGKQATIPLADGSVVRLNTNSQIEVEYAQGVRHIRLVQGEAHFDVAEDPNHPFRVYAGQGRIQALGTAFTVYLREQDVDVLVTEGKVELAVQDELIASAQDTENTSALPEQSGASEPEDPEYYLTLPVEQLGVLAEGQGATIVVAKNNQKGQVQQTHEVKLLTSDRLKRNEAWRKGLLLFTGDSLEEVVAEISRYTPVSIEIEDPELKSIRIGGQFRVGDVNGMFNALEANFGLTITSLDNNRVIISATEQMETQ